MKKLNKSKQKSKSAKLGFKINPLESVNVKLDGSWLTAFIRAGTTGQDEIYKLLKIERSAPNDRKVAQRKRTNFANSDYYGAYEE